MNRFELIVDNVIKQNKDYPSLRTVVEKEILHRDILTSMNNLGVLRDLTFMGGTCLRDCYFSPRLSEDLDFTGGFNFSKNTMKDLGNELSKDIHEKYNMNVSVTEPEKETGNTETWKIKIITKPERPDFPSQKINIDVCMLPSYERKVNMLKDFYSIDTGTENILLYSESLEEIFIDKLIAFARRPNRLKNRDLWDIHWLSQKNVSFEKELLNNKLNDRKIDKDNFTSIFTKRITEIESLQKDFLFEMKRFLVPSAFTQSFTSDLWWQYLINLLRNIENDFS